MPSNVAASCGAGGDRAVVVLCTRDQWIERQTTIGRSVAPSVHHGRDFLLSKLDVVVVGCMNRAVGSREEKVVSKYADDFFL